APGLVHHQARWRTRTEVLQPLGIAPTCCIRSRRSSLGQYSRISPSSRSSVGMRGSLALDSLRQPEGAALRVAAHGPALAGMDDLAAGRTDPSEGGLQVIDREVDEAETVTRAGTPVMDPERRA